MSESLWWIFQVLGWLIIAPFVVAALYVPFIPLFRWSTRKFSVADNKVSIRLGDISPKKAAIAWDIHLYSMLAIEHTPCKQKYVCHGLYAHMCSLFIIVVFTKVPPPSHKNENKNQASILNKQRNYSQVHVAWKFHCPKDIIKLYEEFTCDSDYGMLLKQST